MTEKRKVIRLWLVFIVVGLGFLALKIVWTNLISAPSILKHQEVFSIQSGENTDQIVARLEKEGFIKNALSFKTLLKITGFAGKIQAGEFNLSKNMKARDVITALTHGVSDVKLTFIEGWRVEEMAALIFKELAIPHGDFLRFAQEGYMFPDTYFFKKEATGEMIATMIKENFEDKYDENIQMGAKKQGLSKEEVVILASIVEREARADEERPIIAGILLKRWNNDAPLEADATVQYALGYQSSPKTWWKETLTAQDLETDSPYNTRKNLGLPPAPIGNPGLASIKAVVSPKQTPYWYYAHDKKGKVYWANTVEEHNDNVANYLR